VLMEAGIMMSDDQVHPWRFMLLNFSVLVINKISAFLKREKKKNFALKKRFCVERGR